MSALGIALAAWLAVAAQGDAPVVRMQNVPLGRIDIPDEIAPAVLPYFNCQMTSRGIRRGPTGAAPEPLPEQLGADCSGARLQAARLAEARLRDLHRGTADERRAYVERVLANVDAFAAMASAPTLPPESKPDAED